MLYGFAQLSKKNIIKFKLKIGLNFVCENKTYWSFYVCCKTSLKVAGFKPEFSQTRNWKQNYYLLTVQTLL